MRTERPLQKLEWINNMKKELQGLENASEGDIHQDSLREIIKLSWRT